MHVYCLLSITAFMVVELQEIIHNLDYRRKTLNQFRYSRLQIYKYIFR